MNDDVDVSSLHVQETIARALLCNEEAGAWDSLAERVIPDGLLYFAVNERERRTFAALQADMTARPPQQQPKRGDWDYHRYFLSRDEWQRRNPYRADLPIPGMETSVIENAALEFRLLHESQSKALTKEVVARSLQSNPALQRYHELRQLQVLEKSKRSLLQLLYQDWMHVLALRRKRARELRGSSDVAL